MRWIYLGLFMILGACGGGGATGMADPVKDPDLFEKPVPDIDPVDPAYLPLTGRAGYAGQLSLDLQLANAVGGVRDTITSPLSISVDFAGTDAQVTGEAGSFAGFDGRLYLTVGEIDRAAAGTTPAIAGRVAGTLKEDAESYLIYGTFDGDFRGSTQAAISGRLMGSVLNNNTQSSFEGSYQGGRLP